MGDLLPDNLMLDVLSRLPIKRVIKCKCVCKRWCDLVSDPCFAHLHHSRSPQCLMIDHPCRKMEWVEIENQVGDNIILKNLGLRRLSEGLYLFPTMKVDSVNGLVFMYDRYAAYISNPLVQEYMILPKPKQQLNLVSLGYGFGVSTAGEYKVTRICGRINSRSPNPFGTEDIVYSVEIEVYTLGTDQWRRSLGQAPNYHLKLRGPLRPGVFLDGHVYWIAQGQIYDFDLNAETFKLFPSPSPSLDNQESNHMLGVLKGGLSRFSWSSSRFTLWVMIKSWCKWMPIQKNINSFFRSQDDQWKPLCLVDGMKGTSIVIIRMMKTEKLVAYCLNNNKILHLDLSAGHFTTVMPYRHSFLKLQNLGFERVHSLHV